MSKIILKNRSLFNRLKTILPFLPLIAASIVFAAICFGNITQSIWFDESFSAFTIRSNPWEILKITAADVHPPLYYLVLKPWGMIFGHTDVALRSMSIFFGIIALIFAFLWAKRKFGAHTASIAIGFMALSPLFIRFGVEMRMYAMLAAIIFAATYFLDRALAERSINSLKLELRTPSKLRATLKSIFSQKYWIIYAVLVALGMYTHYFAAVAWLAHLLYIFFSHRSLVKTALIYYVLSIVFYLPWLPFFVMQTASVQTGGFWPARLSTLGITDYFTNSLLYLNAHDIYDYLAIAVFLLSALLAFLLRRIHKKSPNDFANLRPLFYLAFAAPAILALLSLPPFSSVFVHRYLVYAAMALFLLIGLVVALARRAQIRGWLVLATLTLIISIFGIINVYNPNNIHSEPDSRVAYEKAIEYSENGEPIIAESFGMFYDLAFYATPERPAFYNNEAVSYGYGPAEPLRYDSYGKIDSFQTFLESNSKFWYITLDRDDSWQDDFADYSGTFTVIQNHTASATTNNAYQYQVIELLWQPQP